eukprot:Pgem_evm1s6667
MSVKQKGWNLFVKTSRDKFLKNENKIRPTKLFPYEFMKCYRPGNEALLDDNVAA